MSFIELTLFSKGEKVFLNTDFIVCISEVKQGCYVRLEDGDGYVFMDNYQNVVEKLKNLKSV